MKTIIKTTIIVLAVLLLAFPATAYDFMVDGLCYNRNADGTSVTVTSQNSNTPSYTSLSGSLTIPPSVTYDGTTYAVTSIGDFAFRSCTGLTSLTIPNSVTEIGLYAFDSCRGLTSADIPNSVTSIGNFAFSTCGLTSVTIPNSVTSIGNSAFSYCRSLSSITVEEGNAIYDSRENCNAIIETATNIFLAGCKNSFIPNSVTSIGSAAFSGSKGLTSVTIPNSVTLIDSFAFAGCSGLTSVTIPNSVTSIGYSAFSGCSGLTSLTIPNSVTTIASAAFWECTGLTSVTIGESVTEIGGSAFWGCSGLKIINCRIIDPSSVTLGSTVFKYVPKTTCMLHVPVGSAAAYQAADQWNAFTIVDDLIVPSLADINRDGTVDVADISAVVSVSLGKAAMAGWRTCDINGDGSVDVADISIVVSVTMSKNI